MAITCEDVKEKGSGSLFSVEQLKSLSLLDEDGIKDCVIILGKEPLTKEQSSTVWSALIDIYKSVDDIPEESLQHLGWIANGISLEHFYNLSLTEVDTIAAFGRLSWFNQEQLHSLNAAIFEQWSSKDIEDLSSYDLMNLRQILCALNGSEIIKIHPDAYKEAAQELSTLTNCRKDVISGLAELATSPLAFGDPRNWTSLHIASIGCIIGGLSSVRVIPPSAMEGLTKSTIVCLPPSVLQEMSDEQIINLSPSAAGSLSSKQLSALYKSQKYALQLAIKGRTANDKSSSIVLFVSNYLIIIVIVFITF
ncbi:unnamed protein product [Nezara viridula]|uniref:Uncharacterized protein n=1 Tax=Nezara viridula TaxID=85310 RepID=A0A9P0HGQ8_NEZVI|nr:unnamed protein product [Nezara viridula]